MIEELRPATRLDPSIEAAMIEADVILLLVSPDFLASRYCYEVEFRRAMERHEQGEARVIPVILRPCDWLHSPLAKLRATPTDGKPVTKWPDLDDAFQTIVADIRAALPKNPTPAALSDPRPPEIRTTAPRSSNLRLSKSFTQADQDRFLDEAFEYMSRFFEGSLEELKVRNPSIEAVFRRIDRNHFTAVVYRDGSSKARCKISLGGMFGNGISFSHNDRAADTSMNENLSVAVDDQGIYLRALGFARSSAERQRNLSFEGAAEYYWKMLIDPLQRK